MWKEELRNKACMHGDDDDDDDGDGDECINLIWISHWKFYCIALNSSRLSRNGKKQLRNENTRAHKYIIEMLNGKAILIESMGRTQ